MGWPQPLLDYGGGCWLPAAVGGWFPCPQLEVGLELWEEAARTLLWPRLPCPGPAWPLCLCDPSLWGQLLRTQTHSEAGTERDPGHVPGRSQGRWVCLYSHLPCICPTKWEWDSLSHFTDEEVKVTQHQLAEQSKACTLILGISWGYRPVLLRGGVSLLGPRKAGLAGLEGFSEGRISHACVCP